jgi:hypothetical protein
MWRSGAVAHATVVVSVVVDLVVWGWKRETRCRKACSSLETARGTT